jgi:hypothetical protein
MLKSSWDASQWCKIEKLKKISLGEGIPKMWGKTWEYHFDFCEISPQILEISPTHGLYM